MRQECTVRSATGRWVLLTTILASGVAFLAGTAVTVALPAIQAYFQTSLTGLQWVVNANLLSLAALLLVGGSLGDRYGRKRVFAIGIALFTIGALLSGLVRTINLLIVFQGVQGIGAALMIPQSLAIINACFAEKERGQVFGLWAGLSGAVAAPGPWLAGWLIETFSWPAVFLLMVPLGVLALVVTIFFVPESRDPSARRLDWVGTLLVLFGLSGIAYGLITGPVAGWGDGLVLTGLTAGVLILILFLFVELRLREPLIPLHIFRNPLVAGANMVTLFLYFALYGALFFVTLNLQQVQGYTPATTGLGLLPPIVLISFVSGPAGALADRIGPRLQMTIGPAIVAAGMALLALPGPEASYFKDFLPGLVVFGVGMALVIAPLTKSALTVEARFSGVASGVNNAVSRIAALLAVAVLGAIAISTFTARLSETISVTSLTEGEKGQILSQANRLGGITIPDSFGESAREAAGKAVRESFVYSFRWSMSICAGLALIGALVSLANIRNPRRPREPD